MTWEFLLGQFAAQFGLWWIILPAILLGIVVGILPGFSPQNTLIMLLPLTLGIPVEQAFAFMVSLYCANLAGRTHGRKRSRATDQGTSSSPRSRPRT